MINAAIATILVGIVILFGIFYAYCAPPILVLVLVFIGVLGGNDKS